MPTTPTHFYRITMKYLAFNGMFKKPTPLYKFERLEVDANLDILTASVQMHRFATCCQESLIGKDVCLIPEFIIRKYLLKQKQELLKL